MRPDFWFGLTIAVCGMSVMVWAAWPRPKDVEFNTLVIWRAQDGQQGALQWLPGAPSKEMIEAIGAAWPSFKLTHRFTVEGRPVDDEWARSIITAQAHH